MVVTIVVVIMSILVQGLTVESVGPDRGATRASRGRANEAGAICRVTCFKRVPLTCYWGFLPTRASSPSHPLPP